jgi:regulator of cell morphogenesis and NO signaling
MRKNIGQYVAEDYRSAAVFERYGIDFCCGGQVSLASACLEKGLDPNVLERELEEVRSTPAQQSENYGAWELSFLADYIAKTHHAWLNENTKQIAAYANKIAEVHGARHPEVIEIANLFEQVAADMAAHLGEEEEVLFPAVKRLEEARKAKAEPATKDRTAIRDSLEKLHREHEAIGDAVHQIRHLAKDYAMPADACNTFAVTFRKLQEFEEDLHKHVHLENNILFLKAAQL